MIHYQIQPASPEAHLFHITLRVKKPDAKGQKLALPAWIPGSYMIRDFARNIVTLKADCRGEAVAVEKLDKQTWRCAPCPGELRVEYQVYAWDLSVRGAHLDATHGYFNGAALFLRVVGQEQQACRLEILAPTGEPFKAWRLATTLPAEGAAPFDFGRYQAPDYDALIDHPVEMGDFDVGHFEVAGVPHEVVISGRHRADMSRFCADLERICNHHVAFFGELPDMQRYQFQLMVVGDGYGGLEHRSSCSLICNRDDLPVAGEQEISEGYCRLLALCSHEYFHLWHVKRIRPLRLQQADLSQEAYTRLLWAFEGITSYYDELALVRCGLIGADRYLELLAQTITRVLRCAGRHKQSLEESSFDAWIKFYKQDENAPNAIVSYYAKGALVALALDLRIRQQTRDKKSLDDLMRALWQRHGWPGLGVPERGVERLAEEVTGLELGAFFDQALRGTEDLPLESLLATAGIGYRTDAATSATDTGGLYRPPPPDEPPKPVLGARITAAEGGARLAVVFDAGAAQRAGLAAGDLIIAVDGIRATAKNIDQLVGRLPAGACVPLHAFRRDELMCFDVTPQPAPADTCRLWQRDDASKSQRARRHAWLQCGAGKN